MNNADDRIDHRHHQKAHVQGAGAADDEHHGQNHENQVKKGEAVGQNDFFFAFAGIDRLPRGSARLNLFVSQPQRRVNFWY